ncbi:MAG: hypothetical protein PHX27_02050 [Candidatus ainarchaeum sp.]|nr:hypothetical protein [Candidatus ainarchaeum sp.]
MVKDNNKKIVKTNKIKTTKKTMKPKNKTLKKIIQTNNKIINTNKKNLESLEEKTNFFSIDYFKKNKGLTITIIFFIIITAAFLLSLNLQTTDSQDIFYAKAISEEMNYYLDYYITQAEAELITDAMPTEIDPLEKAYLESIIDDMKWLKEKNNELFYSKENVLLKTASLGVFMDKIISLNEEFSFDFGELDYDLTIQIANNRKYSTLELISSKDLMDFTQNEKIIFNQTIDSLGKEYFEKQKKLIANNPIERMYVESKKIIFLFE